MAKRHVSNSVSNGSNGNDNGRRPSAVLTVTSSAIDQRLPVLKTYKIFIGGKFPRTESGRYYTVNNPSTDLPLANVCQASRKDFREAVIAARTAQEPWANRTAYNRSQILYRIAEMLEGRSPQFVAELGDQGIDPAVAATDVALAVDRLVYYAGWTDKYQQIFSSVNPVASSHFNFSVLEPTGVVSILGPRSASLAAFIGVIAPAITGGNAVIALASHDYPLNAITLAEVLATSDLPGGVVNLLTGDRGELAEHFASHMDVNAIVLCDGDDEERKIIAAKSALNVKRVIAYDDLNLADPSAQNPYLILDTQETKTTWHPIGV